MEGFTKNMRINVHGVKVKKNYFLKSHLLLKNLKELQKNLKL